MQTRIDNTFLATQDGTLANGILRNCVHCGFCTATCPTYQITGNELDGPRGRIYLIKQMLEGHVVTDKTAFHLDRCLTCRSCETTCPSGVKYGQLLEIGKKEIEKRTQRPLAQRLFRRLLLAILPYPARFDRLLSIARVFRPLMLGQIKKKIPVRVELPLITTTSHQDMYLILDGCVQPAMSPGINRAARQVLDKLGIEVISFTGCCGAINHHLSDEDKSIVIIKHNIDRILGELDRGIKGIINTASGCGAMIKDYATILQNDADYAAKATKVVEHTFDLVEVIDTEKLKQSIDVKTCRDTIAIHTPCTLQHAQQLPDKLDEILFKCGYQLTAVPDKHLCCGSAGTYSILQPQMSHQVRVQRLEGLLANEPTLIVTANIGCLHHLNEASPVPVIHWIELINKHIQ